MTAQPPIFIITGVPGAGKTTIARELMRRFAYGMHIPVDDLREFVIAGIAHPVPEWTEETGRQFGLARAAAGQIAQLYVEAGFAVAIDDVISPDDAQAAFGELRVAGLVHKILLQPNLDAALGRNAQRAAKAFDPAVLEQTIRRLHGATARTPYVERGWLAIDNSALSVEQTVDLILGQIAPPERARSRGWKAKRPNW